ncbi:DUF3558 domain-containing protein [Gordonia phosphorivorans]|uniref:DUF3558 domain-containing protein n=1 Tax=Gordonia phosphorivorans TaxID=1056982 RepID=A0ABV6H841_9ACTN
MLRPTNRLGSWSSSVRKGAALVLPGLLVIACGASVNDTEEVASESVASEASQTVSLPFSSPFKNRWNSANDGTEYEPCVALSTFELERIGVQTDSVRDAAGTDGQTLRGCTWDFERASDGGRWVVSQMVANSVGLDTYRQKYAADHWLPDRQISGRRVGITEAGSLGECMTYVQSGGAGITTLVLHHRLPHPPVHEVCDRAIEFTKATIDKMPR